jgi:hypothetical protein
MFLKIQSELQYYIYREIQAISLFLYKNGFYFFPVLETSGSPNQSHIAYDPDAIILKDNDKWFDPFRKTLIRGLQNKIPTQMM